MLGLGEGLSVLCINPSYASINDSKLPLVVYAQGALPSHRSNYPPSASRLKRGSSKAEEGYNEGFEINEFQERKKREKNV